MAVSSVRTCSAWALVMGVEPAAATAFESAAGLGADPEAAIAEVVSAVEVVVGFKGSYPQPELYTGLGYYSHPRSPTVGPAQRRRISSPIQPHSRILKILGQLALTLQST